MLKFDLGLVVTTRTICNEIADNETFAKEITNAFERYCKGDWGDMCVEDKLANDDALLDRHQWRIVASYLTSKGKIYILTEADRSSTTITFADEY